MILIDNTIVSDDLLEKKFTCHLEKCKGACCVGGDRGAPLEKNDIDTIQQLLPAIKPFMTPAYAEAVDKTGFYEIDIDDEPVTTCQPTGECNFVVYDNNGATNCAIELAYKAGVIDYKKPISCHLYPIRLQRYKNYTAVNYHRWDLCSAACTLGEELQMPVYRFAREALIRKFGQEWYSELEEVAAG